MNRNRIIVGLAIAIVVGLLFSVYVYRTFQRVTVVRPVETQRIVVAGRALQVGTRLDASNLQEISWPSDAPLAGSFSRIQDCEGRAVITPVTPNEPILEANLAPKAAGAGLPATIPEGMRAVSVAVNDVVGVAGFVTPGTMVDVLVTGRLPNSNSTDNNVTRTILEDVRVLAAGQKIEQDRQGKPETVPVITLLVSPEDADKLTMASTEGKIQLALRNTIDTKATSPAPVMQAALFEGPLAPAPAHVFKRSAPARPVPYEVEVITGAKKETKTFENQ
jgi:pilus assembly protein CpaB